MKHKLYYPITGGIAECSVCGKQGVEKTDNDCDKKENKYKHICVNITNVDFPMNAMESLPNQVFEYYEEKGWELCAVDDIYYFFKKLI